MSYSGHPRSMADSPINYSDAQRWRMVKEFHPRLKLEHWDGRAWQPLYGEEANKIVDTYILEAP